MTQPVKSTSLRKSTTIVAFGTLLSRITGLVRDVVLAGVFGASGITDAFFAAYRIPNSLRRIVAEGGVTVALQPVYADILENQPDARQDFERAFFTLFRISLIVLTILGILAAPWLIDIFAAGLRQTPGLREEAAYLLRVMFPFVYFIGLIGAAMGMLNAHGHFFAPAVGPAFLNLALISGALVAAYRSATGELEATPLAIAALCGVYLFWLLQRLAMAKFGISQSPKWQPCHPKVKEVGKLLLPAFAGLSVYQIQVIIGTQFASFLAVGGFTCLWYADRIVQFPLAVIGTAIGTVALPILSRKHAANQPIHDALGDALSFTLFLVLPASAGIYLVAPELIQGLFGWGALSAEQSSRTAAAVVGYALAVVPASVNRVLVPVFYAQKKMSYPIFAGAIGLLVQLIFSFLLFDLDVYGLAVATAIASLSQLIVLFLLLLKTGNHPAMPARTFLLTLTATLMMSVMMMHLRPQILQLDVHVLLKLVIEVGVGLLCYASICGFFKHPELMRLIRKISD